MNDNTLFLRLAGPMQSWGTSSRFQLRRTDLYPSKSGVSGLLMCAMGVPRRESADALEALKSSTMGVRVDREGTPDWDYHTAGGGHGRGPERAIGIRSAQGKIKKTPSTGEYETLLSRRQYLWDASFLVALRGPIETIDRCAAALSNPIWPIFLGRKCCVPAEPPFWGTGKFDSLLEALSSIPWQPRIAAFDGDDGRGHRTLDCFIDHPSGFPPPATARITYDVPSNFGYYRYGARFIIATKVTVPVGEQLYPCSARRGWTDPYGPGWEELRARRLGHDHDLCVFCKSPAVEVHHLDYQDVRLETLRSLCKLCHDACTMYEYGTDMRQNRVDPADKHQRPSMLQSIDKLLQRRRFNRRAELLGAGGAIADSFFDETPVR
jgi:CRISPR system Cascade subunit CasD